MKKKKKKKLMLEWAKACLFFHSLYLLLPALCIFGPLVLVIRYGQWLLGLVLLLTYIYFSFDGSERRFGRPWRWLTDSPLLMGPIVDYFPMCLHREGAEFDATRRYVFCVSPHGTLAFSRGVMAFVRERFWKRLFPGIETRDLSASAPFYLPIIREIWLGSGCVDASRPVAERILESGTTDDGGPLSLALFPGGEAEQLETERDRYRIFVRRRQGFVRLAIKFGAPLVPVFTFGETSLYSTSRAFYSVRRFIMQRFRICITLFWGQFFLMPHRVPVNMVVGRPIEVEQCGEPTREHIGRVHQQYIDAVQDIFDRNKAKYGVSASEQLVIM
jgi:Diacylglycerol acyltransferase